MPTCKIICGDALEELKKLPDKSVQACVTSPPYWSLRDYGVAGQLGLEDTPEAYIAKMVQVFAEVKRVLRDDGTLWCNMGDSYAGSGGAGGDYSEGGLKEGQPKYKGTAAKTRESFRRDGADVTPGWSRRSRIKDPQSKQASNLAGDNLEVPVCGYLKPKDLCGMPWRLAFALQADGWWLRSDIIWAKPNPMPESVTDRPTKSYEHLFLLAKSQHYFYDADAVREEGTRYQWNTGKFKCGDKTTHHGSTQGKELADETAGRNLRDVWTISTESCPEAHFATFPRKLVEPCIRAGTSEKGCCGKCGKPWERVIEPSENYRKLLGRDLLRKNEHPKGEVLQKGWSQEKQAPSISAEYITVGWKAGCKCWQRDLPSEPCTVFDPFSGSGTVGLVALPLGRSFIGIEINPEYAKMSLRRIQNECGLLAEVRQ